MRVLCELGPVHRAKGRNLPERTAAQAEVDADCCALELDPDDPHYAKDGRARQIRGFSRRSRVRMMYRLSTLDWDELVGIPEMLTLTYPAEFPTSGRVVKAHLSALRLRFLREFGRPLQAVWKLEFQRRGAPHVHLYIGRPFGAWQDFVNWIRAAWHAIVTECNAPANWYLVNGETGKLAPSTCEHAHADQGARIDRQFVSRLKSVRAIAWYFAKHNAKSTVAHYQNTPPEGFEDVGRFWGVWAIEVKTIRLPLTVREFFDVRRALAKLRASNVPRKIRQPSRMQGLWCLSDDGFASAARLLDHLRDEAPTQQGRRFAEHERLVAMRLRGSPVLLPV